MATCRACGVSSRDVPGALTVELTFLVDVVMRPCPDDRFQQARATGTPTLQLRCERCGWSICGDIDGSEFVGVASTEKWPDGYPRPGVA